MTKKNFNKVIIVSHYSDKAENEAALYEGNDETLIVSLNGWRNQLSDCILHTDYNIRKMVRHFKDNATTPWKQQPILSFREYRDSMPDYVVDCTEFEFCGTSIVTAIKFFIYNDIHNILLYVDNKAHSYEYIEGICQKVNEIKECHPNCNIYQISKYGNFDLDSITVKDFYGIHC